ncbi:MAG TPA: riboflavin biosynthesis protein RibF [Candidatus Baltobacteraceae bacterium]
MKIHHAVDARDASSGRPLVVAVGFFDGMHRGHQEIARQTLRLRKPGWRTAVLTFANHPSSHLRPGMEPPLITTPEERLDLLAAAGFDECFFVRFDDAIASISAERFLTETLLAQIGARGVVVGKNFRFGHKRAGDTAMMQRVLNERGVPCIAVENTTDEQGERISSTRIRGCIAQGDLQTADRLLGHSYEIRGRVVLGRGVGHDLNFPTANIALPHKMLPKDGVYSAVARHEGRDFAALVSVGANPTFDGSARTVEAWLRDFHQTIYGHELVLRDLRFVREQQRFDTVEALKQQMDRDLHAVAYPAYG